MLDVRGAHLGPAMTPLERIQSQIAFSCRGGHRVVPVHARDRRFTALAAAAYLLLLRRDAGKPR